MCKHHPPCPKAEAADREAARVVAPHPEQGWSRLCNGVILFEDTGELLPDGSSLPPRRGPAVHCSPRLRSARSPVRSTPRISH
ncbi:MAG: DUF5999 family protein [Micromonosporaceae bacterium]